MSLFACLSITFPRELDLCPPKMVHRTCYWGIFPSHLKFLQDYGAERGTQTDGQTEGRQHSLMRLPESGPKSKSEAVRCLSKKAINEGE